METVRVLLEVGERKVGLGTRGKGGEREVFVHGTRSSLV